MKQRDLMRQFYEEVARGNLKINPRTGVITRTNMGEVVRRYLKERKEKASPNAGSSQ
jgi:hypothetical protein